MIFHDLSFSTFVGAIATLNHMKYFIKKYGYATVADLYHYVGYSIVPYHDAIHWGWDDLTNSHIVYARDDKFYLSFPKMKELNTDEWIFQ